MQTSADSLDEVDETFNVTLTGQSEGNLVDAVGVGTIDDNDGPSLSIANAPVVNEGNSGAVNATFTVTRSAVSPQTVSATFTAADGTATQPGDYAPTTGTVTFAPGDPATKTVTVPVNGDLLDEIDEQFTVGLSAPVDATISGSPASGTINDDDGPTISIANTTVAEGDSGTSLYDVTVSLSAASPQNVSMAVASANGTALAGDDYEAIAAGQTLTIPAGATSGTVQVATIGDVNDEADETFFVNLSNAVDASFADNQAVVTIDDDDGVGGAGSQLSIDDVTLSEGNSGNYDGHVYGHPHASERRCGHGRLRDRRRDRVAWLRLRARDGHSDLRARRRQRGDHDRRRRRPARRARRELLRQPVRRLRGLAPRRDRPRHDH